MAAPCLWPLKDHLLEDGKGVVVIVSKPPQVPAMAQPFQSDHLVIVD